MTFVIRDINQLLMNCTHAWFKIYIAVLSVLCLRANEDPINIYSVH